MCVCVLIGHDKRALETRLCREKNRRIYTAYDALKRFSIFSSCLLLNAYARVSVLDERRRLKSVSTGGQCECSPNNSTPPFLVVCARAALNPLTLQQRRV